MACTIVIRVARPETEGQLPISCRSGLIGSPLPSKIVSDPQLLPSVVRLALERLSFCAAPTAHRCRSPEAVGPLSSFRYPQVDNGYEREFQYVYGAVSPLEGELDWRIGPVMNTEQMGTFLAQVSAAHPEEFIVMVVDGASSHVAQALVVPENIRLPRLPGYSPELNPQEHLWDELREKEFPNRVFSDMAGVVRTLETGLPRLAADRDRVRSICAWPWIVSLNLNAS